MRDLGFSGDKRREDLARLESESFDLLVIGGGINGAGVARDAASRGLRVALVEGNDFASGTSSRSSKLIHGGIRYLENLEFHLVFEALSERHLLFEIAPHLVHPLRFVLPLFDGGRVGMFKMGLGMWLYDALAMFNAPELHERMGPAETLERLPFLQGKGLLGSYAYSDAYMDDDRLVIETLRSAARLGAVVVNYVRALDAEFEGGKVTRVHVADQKSGKEYLIRAHHVVSTVGPWTDQLAPLLVGKWDKHLRPSKGVHLTFSKERFPLDEAVVMAAEDRIVFGIPRHDMVIVGTTDTDYPGDPSKVKTDRPDVDYLLKVLSRYFPGASLGEKDILASYAGVRPLVDDRSASESKTSREHLILNDPRNVTFVMGGKYTTYRRIAEQTVASVLSYFPVEDQIRYGRSQTKCALNPLVTAESYAQRELMVSRLMRDTPWSEAMLWRLVDRHGGEVERILEKHGPALDLRADTESQLWQLEAAFAIEETMCLSLRDFYLRRSPLFLSRANHGREFLKPISRVFQARLALSDAELKTQIEELDDHTRHELAWSTRA